MHFGLADPYDCPKCGQLECVIFVSGGLRSRYPLIISEKKRNIFVLAVAETIEDHPSGYLFLLTLDVL